VFACDGMRPRESECVSGMCMCDKVCLPAPGWGAEAVFPVRLPAGGSRQSSISHCWVQTKVSDSQSIRLCLLLPPLLLLQSALIELDKPSS